MKKIRCWKVRVYITEGNEAYPFDTYRVATSDDHEAREMAIDLAQKDYVGVEGKRAEIAFCNIEFNGWIHFDG